MTCQCLQRKIALRISPFKFVEALSIDDDTVRNLQKVSKRHVNVDKR